MLAFQLLGRKPLRRVVPALRRDHDYVVAAAGCTPRPARSPSTVAISARRPRDSSDAAWAAGVAAEQASETTTVR
jgi:hypothetical protein